MLCSVPLPLECLLQPVLAIAAHRQRRGSEPGERRVSLVLVTSEVISLPSAPALGPHAVPLMPAMPQSLYVGHDSLSARPPAPSRAPVRQHGFHVESAASTASDNSYVDPTMLAHPKPLVNNDFGDTLVSLMSDPPSLDPFGFHRADEFHARLYGDASKVYSAGSDLFDHDLTVLQQQQQQQQTQTPDERRVSSPVSGRRPSAKSSSARPSRFLRRPSPATYSSGSQQQASSSQPPRAIVIPSADGQQHRLSHQEYPLSVPTYIDSDRAHVGSPSWIPNETLSASQGSYDSPIPPPRGFSLAEEARNQSSTYVPNSAPAGPVFMGSSSRKLNDLGEPESQ
jgi:hypothetical protein